MSRLRFALLGHPVKHSVSPAMHAAAFRSLKLSHSYTAIDVPSESALPKVMDELRSGALSGANVTVPYKRAVLPLADEIAPSAAEVGAANVLVVAGGRIVAHNTDAAALTADLGELWAGRPKLRAVVIGAGGAGLAALVACKRLDFAVVGITSRSWSTSEAVHESDSAKRARALGALATIWPRGDGAAPKGKSSQVLRMHWGELAQQADCVINATSVGMLGTPPEEVVLDLVPWTNLARHSFIYDVVYNPRITPFMQAARSQGLRAAGGLGMLVRQAALSIKLWIGQEPELEPMRAAAEEALARG